LLLGRRPVGPFAEGQRAPAPLCAVTVWFDLKGLRQVVIGPEHLGQTLAVFSALEVKTTRGRIREEQEKFLQLVQQLGGRAGVVRSMEEARLLLRGSDVSA
ncbi:MAG: VRR-NUC domain-containing protein, partial [Cyanobium sp.]